MKTRSALQGDSIAILAAADWLSVAALTLTQSSAGEAGASYPELVDLLQPRSEATEVRIPKTERDFMARLFRSVK